MRRRRRRSFFSSFYTRGNKISRMFYTFIYLFIYYLPELSAIDIQNVYLIYTMESIKNLSRGSVYFSIFFRSIFILRGFFVILIGE